MIEATEKNFKKETSSGTVLVEYGASWCGPCQMMEPHLQSLSKEMKSIKFVKVNIDSNPELASQFSITAVPTLILMKDGQPKETLIGYKSKEDLKEWIKKNS